MPGDERPGDERPGDEPSKEQPGEEPADRGRSTDEGDRGETAAALLESAAEIVVGTAIAPFTGYETMPIVATVAEALEGGVERLTHLGHPHEAARETAREAARAESDDAEPIHPGDPTT